MTSTTPLRAAVLPTVAGPLAVVVDPDAVGDRGPTTYGAVVSSGFTTLEDALSRLDPADRARGVEPDSDLGEVAAAVADWDAGDATALDRVSVLQPGGPFLQRAWSALREVGPGETDTYTGLAARAGNPTAVRAAGSACARNRVAPFVPCHRIVRADGGLGGYYYGLPVKEQLLAHEGVLLASG